MKIEMKVRNVGSEYVWSEKYDIENDKDPRNYAQNLVDNFNNTLRHGEKSRELVDVLVVDDNSKPLHYHDWQKTNCFTLKNSSGYYDAMKCSICGITGKRYGVGGAVIKDSKYNAKVYQTCEGAIEHLNKLRSKEKD